MSAAWAFLAGLLFGALAMLFVALIAWPNPLDVRERLVIERLRMVVRPLGDGDINWFIPLHPRRSRERLDRDLAALWAAIDNWERAQGREWATTEHFRRRVDEGH